MLLQLATPKIVARQFEHTVVIRATTGSTCNATILRDKLNKNVARIARPLAPEDRNLLCETLFPKTADTNLTILKFHAGDVTVKSSNGVKLHVNCSPPPP